MAQRDQGDLLLALQILLDHDGLTEDAHSHTLFTIAQLLGGFENLDACANCRGPAPPFHLLAP